MDFGPGDAAPFATIAEQDLLQTYHFTVRRLTLQDGAGTFTREIEVHRGTVAVVAVTTELEIALVRQYRIPLGRWTLEIPAGGVDEGEDVVAAGVRELREDTGLIPGHVRPLTRFANAPGHSTQWTTVLLATGCTAGAARPVGPEEQSLSLVLTPVAAVGGLIEAGAVCDAKSVLGLGQALREGVGGEGRDHVG